jgi:ketosteroid isomerase-like protein
MSDPIGPPLARRAAEAVELVCLAISDGDLEAAAAQYEREAQLAPWAEPSAALPGTLRGTLARLMELRLPVTVRVAAIVPAGELELVLSERRITGPGPDCDRVNLRGLGATVVRKQPGGGWRIVADAWWLAGPDAGAADPAANSR